MKWKFWEREPTPAEETLAELQQEPAAPPPAPVAAPAPAPSFEAPPATDQDSREQRIEMMAAAAEESQRSLMRQFKTIPGLEHISDDADPEFGCQVETATAGDGGTLVITGHQANGDVAVGQVVGVVSFAAPAIDKQLLELDEAGAEAAAERLAAAMTEAVPLSSTVVSWKPAVAGDPARLVLASLTPAQVPVGSIVFR